jgi:type 1 glutamine amidotransferase
MESGGGWLGFHVSAFNTASSPWTWFQQFTGGAAFGVNNWPPLPARLIVDDTESPVTRGIPKIWVAPINEWYSWRPSPRLDKNIRVLVTLHPAQYPLGIKGLITDKDPDVPVVWTNTKFKMLYVNMGHGDKIFTSTIQNRLIENGILAVRKELMPLLEQRTAGRTVTDIGLYRHPLLRNVRIQSLRLRLQTHLFIDFFQLLFHLFQPLELGQFPP